MERNPFRSLPQISEGRPNEISKDTELPLVRQSGRRQRGLPSRADEAHADVQQPRASDRVSKQQFQDSIMRIHREMDIQDDSSQPRATDEIQELTVANYHESPPQPQRQFDSNSTRSCESTGGLQKSSGQSYVQKQRDSQKVRSKAHPGGISGLLRAQAPQDRPNRRELIRRKLARKRHCKTSSDNKSPPILPNQQSVTAPPNWPFGVNPISRQNNIGEGVQYRPLSMREIRLLLRNPHIRNGNMGHLPTPEGFMPPQPPMHVYGTTSEPNKTGKRFRMPARLLTGLKRRNAQRRSSKSPAQQNVESFPTQSRAKFQRGRAARDVKIVYSSPADLARRKSIMPQIQEAANESSDSGFGHNSAPEDDPGDRHLHFEGDTLLKQHQLQENSEIEPRQSDDIPQAVGSRTETRGLSSVQKTNHQNSGDEPPSTGACKGSGLRRFSFAIRGSRLAPQTLSGSSSTSFTPPSSTSLTAATQTSTPASEPDSTDSKHLAQDGTWCGTAGCTWPDCSHIRGTFKLPVPGTVGEKKPEHDDESVAEGENGDVVVSVGNQLSFLKLN